nr:translocation/assembly module TamB domain-containing protein [Treponemataceae bacterium]
LPGGVFGSRYLLDASLSSADSGEKIAFDSVISSGSEVYIDARFSLEAFPLMRIAAGQTPANLMTASGTLSGSLDTLYSSVDIVSSSMRLGESNLEVKGKATLEDNVVSVTGLNAYWSGHSLSDFSGSYNLRSQRAEITSQWTSVLGKRTARSGLSFTFMGQSLRSNNDDQRYSIPDIFTVELTFEDFSWGSLVFDKPVSALLVREQGVTALYAGENEKVTGYLLDDGTFSLSAAPGLAVSFQSNGFIRNSELDLQVSNLMIDIADLWPLTGIDFFSLDSGKISGDLTITGLMADPDFSGTLNVSDCYYAVPNVLKGRHGPISFAVEARDKNVSIPSLLLDISGANALMEASAEFDGWFPSIFKVSGRTIGSAVPVDFNNSLFRAAGFASFDIALLIDERAVNLAGKADFQKGYFSMFTPGHSKSGDASESDRDLLLDLNIAIGKQVEFRWPSPELAFIRGLIQADEPLSIKIDSSQDSFLLKGNAALRGGEIFYLKRNFYLRQGSITLNETQNLFDPYVTIRAEIRERDIDGEFVRIILSVDNQPLSLFSPVLSSDPVRSETEILTLMGQVTTGDASQDTFFKDLVITSSDVLTQLSIFRNTENAVRDFLHLDLFSIRTLVLQNALLGQSGLDTDSTGMTIGNYFDNTTVYIGKYLGSAIYADALLHFRYYDPRSAVQAETLIEPYGNLLAQPEIGFEVNTPLFLLRWGFSPEHRDTLFVADNSVTLSWKFSY